MMKFEELKGPRYYNQVRRHGHWASDEKKKMSVGQKIAVALTGKIRSTETRLAMSKAHKGKKRSPEHIMNLSIAIKKSWNERKNLAGDAL